MRKLKLSPDRSLYSPSWVASGKSTEDSAPVSMFAPGPSASGATVSVRWKCTEDEYSYLQAFLRLTGNGALPFLVDLIIDDSHPIEYVASIEGGTVSLMQVEGGIRTVAASLYAVPTDRRAVRDNAASAYTLIGQPPGVDLIPVLLGLEHLATVTMPGSLA